MPRATRKTATRTNSRPGMVRSEGPGQQLAPLALMIKVKPVEAEKFDDDDPQNLEVSSYFVGEEDQIRDEPTVTRNKRAAPSSLDQDDRERDKRRREESTPGPMWALETIAMPTRRDPNGHSITYHHPLLLNNGAAREDLLIWFDSVASNRAMPWRKPWLNPADHSRNPARLRELLEKRAYEVWISEVMLQQTRVATVIEYWNRWMAKWPTIHDLAAADHQEVLDAWSGLGYYNRATRIHKAAKTICQSFDGLIPDDPDVLEANMDGVGKYTAGAIAAIVFGKAVPLVDGNVLRVLSRQMGLFGDVQKNKKVIQRIWSAARELAEQVVRDEVCARDDVDEEDRGEERVALEHDETLPLSDKPGQWGQALMELGSTICTPLKPDCEACPINSTCRARSEGFALAIQDHQIFSAEALPRYFSGPAPRPRDQVLRDIEDLCTECDAEQEESVGLCADGNRNVKFRQVNNGKAYFIKSILTPDYKGTKVHSARAFAMISHHAEKYPPKANKKKHKLQDSHVFALRRVSDGRYLIQRRPPNGLLPNMWELPSITVDPTTTNDDTYAELPWRKPTPRKRMLHIIAQSELLTSPEPELNEIDDCLFRMWDEAGGQPKIRHIGELGVLPWTFSHIKMTMYVHLFELDDTHPDTKDHHRWVTYGHTQRWLTPPQVEEMSMGSGMVKCWGLVKNAGDEGLVCADYDEEHHPPMW